MAHPDKFTIGRYLKDQYMPRLVKDRASNEFVIAFSFVHPPNSSCKNGGFNRDVRIVTKKASTPAEARVLAENDLELCDLCHVRYIPVLPQSGTIFV